MSEVSPIFFLALELLLLTATFMAFLTRWYLSASILSDPAGPLGVPRRFLHRGQRKGKGYHTGEKLSCAFLLIRHWSHMAWLNPCLVTALSAKLQAHQIAYEPVQDIHTLEIGQFVQHDNYGAGSYLSGKRGILRAIEVYKCFLISTVLFTATRNFENQA